MIIVLVGDSTEGYDGDRHTTPYDPHDGGVKLTVGVDLGPA